jgi:hypothetical protein
MVAVAAIVGLIVPIAYMVTCPMCDGTGEIQLPPNLPEMRILSTHVSSSFTSECESYANVYVNMTATNYSEDDEIGLTSIHVNSTDGNWTLPVEYDVKANSTQLLSLVFSLYVTQDSVTGVNLVSPSGPDRLIVCPECSGAGRVSLLSYALWAWRRFELADASLLERYPGLE